MQNIPEKKIIERCINNDRKYQEMLYRNYADKMYNICLMYADSEDSANDILQDGFIKVFRNLKKFKFEGSFEGWIRRIIVNTALEHYRKKKRETEALQTIGEFSNLVMEEIIDKINAKELVKLVNQLPSRASMVLKLYAIEGYKHHEISQLMGISEGTSKSQLNRARQLLKEAITKLNG